MSNIAAFTNLGALTSSACDLDKVAIIDLGTGQERRFSYRDFEAEANAVARSLVSRGLARGDRVAILSANRFEYLTTIHGIMRAGFVAVPVNFKFPPPPSTTSFVTPAPNSYSATRGASTAGPKICRASASTARAASSPTS